MKKYRILAEPNNTVINTNETRLIQWIEMLLAKKYRITGIELVD